MNIKSLLQNTPSAELNEHQAKQLLKQYQIPVVKEQAVTDVDQAIQAADTLGYPVVLKGLGAKLLHKSEKNLVHLHLGRVDDVRRAAEQIRTAANANLEGFLVQPYIKGHRKLMAGFMRDPQFGPVIMFGLGGVLTEALEDTVLALAPLTEADAYAMLDQIKAAKILKAFRGEAAVDRQILVKTLLALSQIAKEIPQISEIDINPLIINAQGKLYAVDALIKTAPSPSSCKKTIPVPPEAIGALYYPRSIAFIGASAKIGKWGQMLLANTIAGNYQGEIYPVNPKGGTLCGRKVYTKISDIPGPVDLAVVTIPAKEVLNLIPQCQEKGIRSMVLITSGFGETDAQGKALENQLVEQARHAGLLILGPNTMGIANPHINLYCTGATVTPLAGGTAMVAQSGNMGTQLLAFAEAQGIGIRGFAGSGNEAMITVEDYLEGFEKDGLTRIIVLYVESVKNGRRFFESARRISRKKPIVLLKGGQTKAGHRAAASHTGAMVSDSRVFDALCRQAGIVKVEHPLELLDLAAAFSSLPIAQGNRVAIMTLGGGWGVVTADLCARQGLVVPPLDNEIVQRIDKILPSYWSRSNPVDLVGENDLSIPLKIMKALMRWSGCDAAINLGILGRRIFYKRLAAATQLTNPDASVELLDNIAETIEQFEQDYITQIVHLMETYQKPILGVNLLTESQDQTVYRIPQSQYKSIFYETPERAVNALAKMVGYHYRVK